LSCQIYSIQNRLGLFPFLFIFLSQKLQRIQRICSGTTERGEKNSYECTVFY
jgi:hypothetical protein